MADRDIEITKVAAALAENCRQYLELTEIEKTGFLLLQSQINALTAQQIRLLQENRVIEDQNNAARGLSQKIADTANEEAERILLIANERNFKTIQGLRDVETYLSKVKQFCASVEMQRQYKEMEQGAVTLKKAVAVK